jgi:hypothetical protein
MPTREGSNPVETLKEPFNELAKELDTLPEEQPDPKTAFELLSEGDSEGAWQSYLAYFIDPDKPHGLEDAFLREILDLLSGMGGIPELSYPSHTSGRFIEVKTEYQSSGDRPDVLILNEGSWYVCAELKVGAKENKTGRGWQTERYAKNDEIVPSGVDEYEQGAYVYIAPADSRDSRSDEFVDIWWRDISERVRSFLSKNATKVPGRTASQLDDFASTIENETAMTEIDSPTKEKKELYFEYYEEIKNIESSVELFVEKVLQKEWDEKLEEEFEPDTAQDYGWLYEDVGESWGKVVAPSWKKVAESLKLDIHFEHRPIESYFRQGRLEIFLELEEIDNGTCDPEEGDRYHAFKQDVLDRLEEVEYSIEGDSKADLRLDKRIYGAYYQFSPGDEEEYYSTLSQAVDEHTWLVDLVNQLLDEEDYEEYPLSV